MHPEKPSYQGLLHAGAGAGLFLVQLGAFIPGFLPVLALTLVLVALVVVPMLVLGLVLTVLLGPPAGIWWLVRRHRRRVRPTPLLPTLEA
jgi:ABC-type sugar transport system permease subunit